MADTPSRSSTTYSPNSFASKLDCADFEKWYAFEMLWNLQKQDSEVESVSHFSFHLQLSNSHNTQG